MKKNILFLIIIILIFLGFLIYGIGRGSNQGSNDLVKEPQNKNEQISSENVSDLTEQRKQAMNYVSSHISQLSPAEPVLGGKWYVTRFWWPKNQPEVKDFYVEYEDGHILAQIIVRREMKNGEPTYQTIASFEPAEDGWNLKHGENTLFGQGLELYEFNNDSSEWEKKWELEK